MSAEDEMIANFRNQAMMAGVAHAMAANDSTGAHAPSSWPRNWPHVLRTWRPLAHLAARDAHGWHRTPREAGGLPAEARAAPLAGAIHQPARSTSTDHGNEAEGAAYGEPPSIGQHGRPVYDCTHSSPDAALFIMQTIVGELMSWADEGTS